MASMSEKTPAVAPTGTSPKNGLPSRETARAVVPSATDDVANELEQLRDCFRKTTNALASAPHDLKRQLAYLNGYIELLQSQNLGPLNDSQREVMRDLFSSG